MSKSKETYPEDASPVPGSRRKSSRQASGKHETDFSSERKRAADTQHWREETGRKASVTESSTLPSEGDLTARKGKQSIQNCVAVLDKKGRPLQPTSPRRARILLKKGRARVHRLYPFTIRLVDRLQEESTIDGVELKVDPGAKTTGLAITVTNSHGETKAILLSELVHNGWLIKKNLQKRAALRRGRRSRKLRYRAPRWHNRARRPVCGLDVWLPPSIRSRPLAILNLTKKWAKLFPITCVWIENVKFDMQRLRNPAISGKEYQQGALAGYELKEYLLEKFNRKCAYCDKSGIPLNVDHVVPRARGGTDAVSNLVLACVKCNQKKSAKSLDEFLAEDKTRLAKIKRQLKVPLRDAAAVNVARKVLPIALVEAGFIVKLGSGAQTKLNRKQFGIPKSHALDALCVGADIKVSDEYPSSMLVITCQGRGGRQRQLVDKFGFPRGKPKPRSKQVFGFATGDLVRAVVPKGKKQGEYFGRVAVRSGGNFNIKTLNGTVQGIKYSHCQLVQRADGYGYQFSKI